MNHPNLSDQINANISQSEKDGGVDISKVMPGNLIAFRTRNTLYLLRREDDGSWMLKGNAVHCPNWIRCVPHGSTWGGSMIKAKFLGKGMQFECGLPPFKLSPKILTTTAITEIIYPAYDDGGEVLHKV